MERLTYEAAYISNNEACKKYVRTNIVIFNTLPSPQFTLVSFHKTLTPHLLIKSTFHHTHEPTCLHSHEHPLQAPTI